MCPAFAFQHFAFTAAYCAVAVAAAIAVGTIAAATAVAAVSVVTAAVACCLLATGGYVELILHSGFGAVHVPVQAYAWYQVQEPLG